MGPDTLPAGRNHPLDDSADGWDSADERDARSTPPDTRCSDDAHGASFHDPGPRSRDGGPSDDAGASGALRGMKREPVNLYFSFLISSSTSLAPLA